MKQLKIQLCTWNVSGSNAPDHATVTGLLKLDDDIDLYSFSFQEIETGFVQTARSFVSYDEWTRRIMSVLCKRGYFLVESVRVQGISLCLFAQLHHLSFINFIKTDFRKTGFNGNWGNKGGVAISCNIYGRKICFLNTHLPASLEFNESRIRDFNDIVDMLEFDRTRTLLCHDVVFWFGDLNFRIEDIPRSKVEELISRNAYDELLAKDQLKEQLCQHPVITQFVEGPITFPPTYKFDPGTDVYDTSEKQRKPAWTDRILYRVNPGNQSITESMFKMSLVGLRSKKAQFSDLVKLVQDSYTSLQRYKQSDHKPVTAQFVVRSTKDASPLITLMIGKEWKNGRGCKVTIRFHSGMSPEPTDYLALYENTFTDFRSYKYWTYVSAPPEKMLLITCKFPVVTVTKTTSFRIGYYSSRMSSLLTISEPFLIKL